MRNHTLDQVFFAQPVQFTVYFRHEISHIFLIYLHLFQVIDYFQQLFLANLFTGRHFTNNKLLADNPFDFTHFTFLAQVDDGDARLSGTSCTSATVSVAFGIIRQAIIDDVGQIVHIQSAGGNVRGNQDLQVADTEFLHDGITLCLA